MLKRHLSQIVFSDTFHQQMRFVAGPRQCGKTVLVQKYQQSINQNQLYFNWDYRETRLNYQADSSFFLHSLPDVPAYKDSYWFCFDEIHKYPKWKNILKEIYDKYHQKYQFVITGSVRLDMFRKSGDSLAGRYFLFRLNPLMLSEYIGTVLAKIEHISTPEDFISACLSNNHYYQDELDNMLLFSGFPDPLINQSKAFHNKWKNSLIDRIIYEDLREISQVHDLESISRLLLLIPERIGSPVSVNALSNALQSSYNATQNYMRLLELAYIMFTISPYHERIERTVTKEKKGYLFDWTHIKDPGARFENFVALELKALVDLLVDRGADFSLFYIRSKDGKESDFLICKDKEPWLIVEAKLSKTNIDSHHYNFARKLGNIPVVQIIQESNVAEQYEKGYQVSASRFFS